MEINLLRNKERIKQSEWQMAQYGSVCARLSKRNTITVGSRLTSWGENFIQLKTNPT